VFEPMAPVAVFVPVYVLFSIPLTLMILPLIVA
jgi:hypothetical protein